MKKFLVLTVFAGLVGFVATPAHAAITLKVDGTTIKNNSGADADASKDAIVYVGNVIDFTTSVNTGVVTSLPSLDLSNVLGKSKDPGTVVVEFTETGLSSPAGIQNWLTQFSGNVSNGSATVQAQTYIDTTNTAFGMQTPLGNLTSSSSVFGLSSINAGGGSTPFSLTEVVTIAFAAAGTNFSLDTQLSPVPEPASLGILGATLAGLGMMRRRKSRA